MKPRHKLYRVAKWAGMAATALLLLVWALTALLSFRGGAFKFGTYDFGPETLGRASFESFLTSQFTLKHNAPIAGFTDTFVSDRVCEIPFWVCALVIVAPTAWLWHRDRRFSKPGLCKQCSYDIRGLQKCPECGVGVKA